MESDDHYMIKVEGHINSKRLGQFGDTEVNMLEGGITSIECSACDQSRLHSVLDRIRDLGLILVEVRKMNGGK